MTEPTNADRAQWAENALNTFALETYGGRTFTEEAARDSSVQGDAYSMLSDLVVDLMHLANKHAIDPEKLISNALSAFLDEVDEEAEDDSCGQCEGTGVTQSASNLKAEECPVCDGSGTIESENVE